MSRDTPPREDGGHCARGTRLRGPCAGPRLKEKGGEGAPHAGWALGPRAAGRPKPGQGARGRAAGPRARGRHAAPRPCATVLCKTPLVGGKRGHGHPWAQSRHGTRRATFVQTLVENGSAELTFKDSTLYWLSPQSTRAGVPKPRAADRCQPRPVRPRPHGRAGDAPSASAAAPQRRHGRLGPASDHQASESHELRDRRTTFFKTFFFSRKETHNWN